MSFSPVCATPYALAKHARALTRTHLRRTPGSGGRTPGRADLRPARHTLCTVTASACARPCPRRLAPQRGGGTGWGTPSEGSERREALCPRSLRPL